MQLWTIVLAELAPLVLGAAAAVGIWLAAGRRSGGFRSQAGVLAAIGGLVPVAVSALYTVVGVMQLLSPLTGEAAVSFFGARFVTPLGAGIVALVILSVPGGRRPRSFAGTIVRRTAFSFLAPRWAVAAIATVGVTVAVSVAAGLESEPDHEGHYAITTGSSSVRESFPTDTAGMVTIWSPFAALGGFLSVSSIACIVLGAALCVGVILTAVPAANRARQAMVKNAP